MPPRSLCLNVFTSSLGNDSATDTHGLVTGSEHEREHEAAPKREPVEEERTRHDSVQGFPNEPIATPPSYTFPVASPAHATAISVPDIAIALAGNMTSFFPQPASGLGPTATYLSHSAATADDVSKAVCDTCAQAPAPYLSIFRCSRCKRAYYCSKSCQRAAWKTHKYDCDSTANASSAMHTPHVSAPASPINRAVSETSACGLPKVHGAVCGMSEGDDILL